MTQSELLHVLDYLHNTDGIKYNLDYIIGIEWDTSSSSTVLKHIDAYGNEVTKTAEQWTAWFNAHPVHGNMWRCLLSAAGWPTFGSNARGDGLTLDGSAGQVMVRIPKFYVRSEKVGAKVRWWISPFELLSFELHPAFKQRSGTERSQIYIGAYFGCLAVNASGTEYMLSKSGEQPWTGGTIGKLPFGTGSAAIAVGDTVTGATSGKTGVVVAVRVASGTWAGGDAAGFLYLKYPGADWANWTNPENIQVGGVTKAATTGTGVAMGLTRQNAETYCNNIGSRWGCENVWTLDAITLLYLTEYANWNSQSLTVGIGQGIVNKAAGTGFAGEINGFNSADTNIGTNGTGKGTGADGLTPIIYRGIESPWGNVWQFIIGLDALDAAYRVLKRDGAGTPACPLTAGNYESSVAAPVQYNAGTNPDGYAKDILFEDLTKYLFLANLGGGSSSTYMCDYITWHRAGQVNILLAGGYWANGAACGVGCRHLTNVSSFSFRNVGARPEFA